MAKHGPRLTYHHIMEASALTLGDLASKEAAIARPDMLFGRQADVEKGFNLFLTPEQMAEKRRLLDIAKRQEKRRLKAVRRAAEDKPYGQGAKDRVVYDTREPLEDTPRYKVVGKPKPHGPRPSGYVCKKFTGL